MTVKEFKEKVNKLPDSLDDLPIRIFDTPIKNGVGYMDVSRVLKIGKSKDSINCVGISVENNGDKLEL